MMDATETELRHSDYIANGLWFAAGALFCILCLWACC